MATPSSFKTSNHSTSSAGIRQRSHQPVAGVLVPRRQEGPQSAAGAVTSLHRNVRHQPSHKRREVRRLLESQQEGITLTYYRSLYRRSLKLALDWAVQRNLWRGQAVYIRSLFDANKNIRDPRQQRVRRCLLLWVDSLLITARQVLFTETEKLLQKWKHPDPYVPPTAPGGSKYERNIPAPDLPREYDFLMYQEQHIDLLYSTAEGASTKLMIDCILWSSQSLYIAREKH